MIKKLLLSTLTLSSLYAEGISDEKLSSIYTEAVAFVVVIAFMSLVSWYYSRKHAIQYDIDNPVVKKEKPTDEEIAKKVRLVEITKMLRAGTLSQEEYDLLKQNLKEKEA